MNAAAVGETVLRTWRAVLHADDLGEHDDFYTFGGTSLAAAEIAAALHTVLGVSVPVGDVLRSGTPHALIATILRAAASADTRPDRLAAAARDSAEVAPATVQQQAIWFLEQLDGDNRAYNTVAAVTLRGRLNVDALQRAIEQLLDRHAVLRTTFHIRNATLVQQVHPERVLQFDRVALGGAPPADVQLFLRHAGRQRFDVRTLPLIRWTLADVRVDEWVLAQVEHHFVHDGWSMWILLTELAAIYTAIVDGREPSLPPLAFTYENYGHWQRRWLMSDEAARQTQWWTALLADAPSVFGFPAETTRPPQFTFEGDTVAVSLPAPLRLDIAAAAARASVTPFAIMMAAFALLLSTIDEADAVTIGSMLRNRRVEGFERVVGMFVNTVAVPVRGCRTLSFEDLARQVFELLAEAQNHQELPFPIATRALALPRQFTRNPLFQVCFSMNDWPAQRLDFGPELQATLSIPSNGGAKFDLDVVLDNPQQGTFLWRYYGPLFSRDAVAAMATRYERLLASCVNTPTSLAPAGE